MPSFATSISVSGAAAPTSPPSSAAVLEFVCLFTHDLRRKQKRWQDGRLKYHTFNKRVMVYDERGNFIGDMHWRHDHELGDGEEIELERGSALVQVVECVGRKEQDLSELLDKRVKEKEQRQLNLAARSNGSLSARPTSRPIQPQAPLQVDHFQSRHRPLHQLIGTPTGHHGRALAPTESPYEQRHSPNNAPEEQNSASRPSKRRKYDDVPSKSGYAQALFGATLTLSATPMSSAPSRPRPMRARSPSTEAENRTSSQEQEVLREQPKSSRHFNQQGVKKARNEPVIVKQADPMPHNRLMSASKQGLATKGQCNGSIEKPANRPYDRRQPEVITLEDDDVNEGLQAETPTLSPRPPNIPTRQTTEKTAPEKHKSRRKRAEAEASREEPDNELSKSGPSKQRTKTKPVDQDLLSKRTNSSATKSASHERPLSDDGPKQHALKPLEKPEEARTELRIKSQKKRGLLMMSDSIRATPRISVKPSPPERNAISNPSVSNGAPVGDDSFASSPPRVEQQQLHGKDPPKQTALLIVDSAIRPDPSNIQIDVDDDDQGNDTSLSPVRVEATTSKRLKSRRRMILDEDDEDADVTGESLRKRRGRSATVDGDAVSIDMEDQEDVEPPKKRSRKSKKPRDLEETDVLETDSNDTATSRRNPRRAAAQRRQRAREDTPVDADNSDLGETDEVQEPRKKRQRGDELPQVPTGPRLARLSKKSVKSREVIGLRLDDAAMFRGFAATTKAPVQQSIPQQESKLLVPTITNSKLIDIPEENNSSKGDAALKLESAKPDLGRSAQVSKPGKEQTSSENQVTDNPSLPAAPEERVKPDGRQEAKEESKGAASPTSDTVTNQPTIKPAPSSPVATTGEPVEVAEPVEVDLLEGFSLSPVVFSPVKPSLSTASAHPESSNHGTSVPGGEEALPNTERPEQLAPCPAPPERRSVNGLGRTNSGVSTLQARGQTTEAKAPETPKDAAAKPPTVARIVNPATRGRKAALKSHAAGQVPQSVLPANNPAQFQQPTVIYIERPAPEAESPKPKQVKKMSFPGFAPARQSGPWSREAFDLLEKGRPV